MDQIYGLCQPCTYKVNSHLKKQDLQIGDYLVKNRRSSVVANGNKQLPGTLKHVGNGTLPKNGSVNTVVMQSQTTTITAGSVLNGSGNKDNVRHRASMQPPAVSQAIKNAKMNDSLVSLDNSMNASFGTKAKFTNDDFNNSKAPSPSQQFFKKAYTIAGTVPSMMIKQTKQALNNISINATQASFLDENYFEFEEVDSPGSKLGTTYILPNGSKTVNGHGLTAKPERKIKVTLSSIMTIVVDLVILALINLMFACDLINLVNDSGVLVIANPLGSDEESDYPYFQTLLSIYRYKILIFVLMVILSARLAYKRYVFQQIFNMRWLFAPEYVLGNGHGARIVTSF